MIVSYVAQPNGYGCAIACMAMITARTYDEMESWLVEHGLARSRMVNGLHSEMWTQVLGDLGFANRRMWQTDTLTNVRRLAWPPVPFATVHIAATRVGEGSHAVVVLADGAVLDPYKRERTTLTHTDYLEVSSVTGFYPVAKE
jgi:hypothetical protein